MSTFLVGTATATSTTLLSFGLLALSPSPALRTLGITITGGVTLERRALPDRSGCPRCHAREGRRRL